MTRFDSCGTYQVSERSVAVFFTGNDLVSERVDLLTHLPATPEGSDFTDVSRTRDYADRLGLPVESSSIATSGILPGPFASNFAVPPET